MKSKVALLSLFFFMILSQSIVGGEKCQVLYPIFLDVGNNKIRAGYINCEGKVIVEPRFESASDFSDPQGGVGIVFGEQKLIGYKEDGHGIFERDTGIVDITGKIILLPNTVILSEFSEGLALANIGKRWVYINKSGKEIISIPESIDIDSEAPIVFGFSNGVAVIKTKNGICLVSKDGKVDCRDFSSIENIEDLTSPIKDVREVRVEEGYTLIDKKGQYLIPPQKNSINEYGGSFIAETDNGKWLYLDDKGRKFLEVQYDYAGPFSQDLAAIKIKDKWGYMNKKGNTVIPVNFEDASNFDEGELAYVKLNGKYGFISRKGKFIIPPVFDYINKPFNCGLAYVQKGNLAGYINKKGEWVWQRPIA